MTWQKGSAYDATRLRFAEALVWVAGPTGLAQTKLTQGERNLAGWTGLEPAASGVTGRRSNQLNYHPKGFLRAPQP